MDHRRKRRGVLRWRRWRGKARGERQMVRFAADRDDRLDPRSGTRVHIGFAEVSVIRQQRFDFDRLHAVGADVAVLQVAATAGEGRDDFFAEGEESLRLPLLPTNR